MKNKKHYCSKILLKPKGVALLMVIFILGSIIFIIHASAALVIFWQLSKSQKIFQSFSLYYAAYSGINDALLKIERNKNLNGTFSLSVFGSNDVSVNVINNSNSALINSMSVYGNMYRKIESSVSIDSESGLITIQSFQEKVY